MNALLTLMLVLLALGVAEGLNPRHPVRWWWPRGGRGGVLSRPQRLARAFLIPVGLWALGAALVACTGPAR